MTEVLQLSPERGIISINEFLRRVSELDIPTVMNNKGVYYYNIPCAFDIEVSSFMQNEEKKASMYIWQFGILNWVTCGRTWDEFEMFISVLSTILNLGDETRLVVYVQNLGYEFQFIRKHFEWSKLFFLEERKPVYAITDRKSVV